MKHTKLIAGIAGLSIAAAGTGAAVAAKDNPVPATATIKEKASLKIKPNRYVKDGMRFAKDVYTVKSGGTVKLVLNKDQEGPHTLSVVRQKDLPKTGDEAFNHCKPCDTFAQAHGFDQSGEGPPQFQYVENGQGQNDPPNLDRAGDSGVTGPNKGDTITFHVTAEKGKTLHFMCVIHPWMQAKIKVR
jgi:plastocyanin